MVVQNVEGLLAEMGHDALRVDVADSGQDAGGEIALHAFVGAGENRLDGGDAELAAVFLVPLPMAGGLNVLPLHDAWHGAHQCDLPPLLVGHADDGIGACLVLVDDALHVAAKGVLHGMGDEGIVPLLWSRSVLLEEVVNHGEAGTDSAAPAGMVTIVFDAI